jgi:hypothetical protein
VVKVFHEKFLKTFVIPQAKTGQKAAWVTDVTFRFLPRHSSGKAGRCGFRR